MAALQLTALDPGREVCLAISLPTFCIARILLPIDFAEPCARAAHHAAALARLFDSELTVLRVQNGDNVTPVVTTATKNLNADLLVIGRSSEGSPFGSIETNSYSLIRNSNCPVVSV
jgi:nucleotide-binding universal stress UspA family protein